MIDLASSITEYINSHIEEHLHINPNTINTDVLQDDGLICAATRSIVESAMQLWSCDGEFDEPLKVCEWILRLGTETFIVRLQGREDQFGQGV